MAKKVALAGFADVTLHHLKDVPDDWEIWTAGRGWVHPIINRRLDRIVEIHDWGWLKYLARKGGTTGRQHYDWLVKEKHDVPVYMMAEHDEVHNSVRYPFEEIEERFAGTVMWGDKPVRPFTCTLDYLMALALYEGYEEIRIIGVEMSYNTEYLYQKPGMAFWLGMANAMGVKVWFPPESMMFRPTTYHEGGHVIGRHTAEKFLEQAEVIYEQRRGTYEQQVGALNYALSVKADEAEVQELAEGLQQSERELYTALGYVQAMKLVMDQYDTEDLGANMGADEIKLVNGSTVRDKRPKHRNDPAKEKIEDEQKVERQ